MSFYNRDNFMPDDSAGYLIKRCNQLNLALLDRTFAEEELTASQWSTLLTIHLDSEATCASLARDLAYDKGAMTRLIDVLEARGLVERARSEDDRRVVNLSLTEAGRDAAMRCRDKAIGCWNRHLAGWSTAEIEQFLAQLRKLRHTLEETDACAD